MAIDIGKQQEIAYKHLDLFTQNRVEYYSNPRKWITVEQLLAKDVLMFASRGVVTSDEFVTEAFHARESSSEETVMGNQWQAFCGEVVENGLDTGDLTVDRDDALWMCELKSQKNTVNAASFPQEIRDLKRKVEIQSRFQRATRKPVKAAYCILRSSTSKDEMTEFHSDEIRANRDIEGYEYRWLEGKAFWRWLADIDEPADLIDDVSRLDIRNIVELREQRLHQVMIDFNDRLDEHGLPHNMNGVLELKRIIQREKAARQRERAARRRRRS